MPKILYIGRCGGDEYGASVEAGIAARCSSRWTRDSRSLMPPTPSLSCTTTPGYEAGKLHLPQATPESGLTDEIPRVRKLWTLMPSARGPDGSESELTQTTGVEEEGEESRSHHPDGRPEHVRGLPYCVGNA